MTMARGGNLCYDSAQNAATAWSAAWVHCLNTDRRLPTTGELGLVYYFTIANETNWTDDATSASNHYAVRVAGFTIAFEDHPNSDSVGFRCVLTPHNNLGPSPTSATAAKSSIRKARYLRIRTRHN